MPRGERYEAIAVAIEEHGGADDEPVDSLFDELIEGFVNVAITDHIRAYQLEPEGLHRGLHIARSQNGGRIGRVEQETKRRQTWNDLAQQTKLLGRD